MRSITLGIVGICSAFSLLGGCQSEQKTDHRGAPNSSANAVTPAVAINHQASLTKRERYGKEAESALPLFDLEASQLGTPRALWESSRVVPWPSRLDEMPPHLKGRKSLQLVATPERISPEGLAIHIQVWNLTDATQLVSPLYPDLYQLEFQREGKYIRLYNIPPIHRRLMHKGELPRIKPGRYLGATYLLPQLFVKAPSASKLRMRVIARDRYTLSTRPRRFGTFELDSGWISI